MRLAPVANDWFGRGIGVAGLLTGQDIQSPARGRATSATRCSFPPVAVRDGAGVFLDDLTPADLARAAAARPSIPVEPDARGPRSARSSAG